MTIIEAIERNKRSGSYFFSPGAMKFFDSKVESEMSPDRCFVTSECSGLEGAERMYTVRQFNEDFSDVRDVSAFMQFRTLDEALELAFAD